MTDAELTATRNRLAELMKAEERHLTSKGTTPVASPLPAIYRGRQLLATHHQHAQSLFMAGRDWPERVDAVHSMKYLK